MRITYQLNPHVTTSLDIHPFRMDPLISPWNQDQEELDARVDLITHADVKGLFELFIAQEGDPLNLTPVQKEHLLSCIVEIESYVNQVHMNLALKFETQSHEQESAK